MCYKIEKRPFLPHCYSDKDFKCTIVNWTWHLLTREPYVLQSLKLTNAQETLSVSVERSVMFISSPGFLALRFPAGQRRWEDLDGSAHG